VHGCGRVFDARLQNSDGAGFKPMQVVPL